MENLIKSFGLYIITGCIIGIIVGLILGVSAIKALLIAVSVIVSMLILNWIVAFAAGIKFSIDGRKAYKNAKTV